MEGNKSKSRALLVFGAPGSGKSTFSEKFGKKFGLAYYDFEELKKAHNFTKEQIMAILCEILKTRQTIIIQGEMNTEKDRKELRTLLQQHNYEPALIWIQTDIATIKSRLKSKFKSVTKAKETYDKSVTEMESPSDAEHPIILSGKHTFETQTKHVITGLADLTEAK